MIFTRLSKTSRPTSAIAMALVLAATGSLGVAMLEQPAHAAKKDKKKSPAQDYSKGFIAVYSPLAEQTKGDAVDWAALAGQLPTVIAAAETDSDRFAAGQITYNIGTNSKNEALMLQGAELMLASGKVPAENQSQYNMMAGQLAYKAQNWSKARTYLNKAVELGYADSSPQGLIAESYFAENNFVEGLSFLEQAIKAQEASGAGVDTDWVRRGLSVAYKNELQPQTSDFALMFVKSDPTTTNWGEVIAINAYGGGYDNPEILDLMRLAFDVDAMRDERMYADYIDAADYRRLPGEVVMVIDKGISSGKIDPNASYAADIRGQAATRAKADRAEMASILRSANAATDPKSIITGADVALSYGDYATAETLYSKAKDMPGADKGLALTRLGIAQMKQGKIAEAKANFDAVTGKRLQIARLWSTYADQKLGG